MTRKTVTGRLTGPRTVELDEAVESTDALEVLVPAADVSNEVLVREAQEFFKNLPLLNVPKEELDRRLKEERDSWER
jgi:hypothetical protein